MLDSVQIGLAGDACARQNLFRFAREMNRETILAVVHRAKSDLVSEAPDPLAVGDGGGELPAQTGGGALTPHAKRLLDDVGRRLAGRRSSVRRQLLTQVGGVVEPARERCNQPVSGRYRAVGDLIILGHTQRHRTVLTHLLARPLDAVRRPASGGRDPAQPVPPC